MFEFKSSDPIGCSSFDVRYQMRMLGELAQYFRVGEEPRSPKKGENLLKATTERMEKKIKEHLVPGLLASEALKRWNGKYRGLVPGGLFGIKEDKSGGGFIVTNPDGRQDVSEEKEETLRVNEVVTHNKKLCLAISVNGKRLEKALSASALQDKVSKGTDNNNSSDAERVYFLELSYAQSILGAPPVQQSAPQPVRQLSAESK